MTGRPQRRFPLDVIINIDQFDNVEISRRFGVSSNTLWRWKKHGVPAIAADRLAIRLNRHPLEVWPNFYEDIECSLHT